MSCHVTSHHVTPCRTSHVKSSQTSSKGSSGTKCQVNELTGNEINIIRPWSSFAIPASIGSSILPVSQVSSWTCRTPSLMLNCKGSITTPGSCRKALIDGGGSSSVEATDNDVSAIHLWNSPTASVSETSNRFDCKE